MLSVLELADGRADALVELPDTCVIIAPVLISDGSTGTTPTWPGPGTTVACLVSEGDTVDTTAGGEILFAPNAVGRTIITEHDVTIGPNYHVTWTGKTLQVLGDDEPGSLALVRVVAAVELTPEAP